MRETEPLLLRAEDPLLRETALPPLRAEDPLLRAAEPEL